MNNFNKTFYLKYPILIILVSIIFLVTCENHLINNVLQPKTITFESNGGTNIENQILLKGERITRPSDPLDPHNQYNRFAGWYQDNFTFRNTWDFDAVPLDNMTLYAKWELMGITLNPQVLDFGSIFMGYAPVDPHTVTITNLAPHPTGELEIAISGVNADVFIVSPASAINSISPGSTETFTVSPIDGLAVGTYTAAITITGINDISASLNITLTVNRTITNITIVNQPANLSYIYGQPVNLSGLSINIEYLDGGTENNVPHINFAERGITTIPAHNQIASVLAFNNQPIEIIADIIVRYTDVLTISQRPVTIIGVNALNKIYDGTVTATLGGVPAIHELVPGDDVLVANGIAAFADKNAGTHTVTFSGFSLSGADAGNYILTAQPASVQNTITRRQLVIGNPTVTTSKVFDGMPDAVAAIGVLQNLVTGDDVTAAITSVLFNSPNVANANLITVIYDISGTDAGNYYAPVNFTIIGNITRATPDVTEWPTGMTATFGNVLHQVTIPNNGISDPVGVFSWTTPNDLVGNADTQTHNMTFTVDNNYITRTQNVDVDVRPAPIPSAAINVVAPIAGNTPDDRATINTGGNFTVGSVTWTPTPNSAFRIDVTHYTASVTLTANTNFTFTGGLTSAATINGFSAIETNNTGLNVTLSYEFETGEIFVTGIIVETQPLRNYIHGDLLDLSELVITLIYNDNSRVDVEFNDFSTFTDRQNGTITTNITNGTQLSRSNPFHNNAAITVTYEDETRPPLWVNTLPLIINTRGLTITGVTATNRPYNANTTVGLNGGTLLNFAAGETGTVGFSLGTGTMLNAFVGNGKAVNTFITLSGAGIFNYHLIQPTNVTVNITPAALTIISASTTKQFDGTNTIVGGITVTLGGILGSDDVLPDVVTAVYTGVNAGTNRVNITNVTLMGTRANEYTVTPQSNLLVEGGGITIAAGAEIAAPILNRDLTGHNSITVYPVSAPATGQSVQYAISTEMNPETLNWGNYTTFTLFNNMPFNNTTYYVFARSAENSNYFTGLRSQPSEAITFHRVTFNSNGGNISPPERLVLSGNSVSDPGIPTRSGFYLDGWYTDNDMLWDFNNDVTSNMTLTARWLTNPNITIRFQDGGLVASGDAIIYLTGGFRRPTSANLTLENPQEYSSIRWYYNDNGFYHMHTLHLDSLNPLFNTAGTRIISLTVLRNTVQLEINITFIVRE
jgi:uncharacterized repeat protein (TIGR02543 family)